MSHLNEYETEMDDQESLISALIRQGFTREQIEVHQRAQTLVGYHGVSDGKVAHVIIRQKNAKIPSDIGWEFKNKIFLGHVDSYDYTQRSWGSKIRLDDNWSQGLQQCYNQEVIKQGLTDKGYEFRESVSKDGYPVFSYYHTETPQQGNIIL